MRKILMLLFVAVVGVSVAFAYSAMTEDKSPAAKPQVIPQVSIPQVAKAPIKGFFSKETPYTASTDKIKTPPDGYSMFFIETMARHGSRTATNAGAENDALKVWRKAAKKGALTELGKTFGDDVKRFQADERKIGYGMLTTRGKAELAGIGKRTAANYRSFFKRVQDQDESLGFVTTPVVRTKRSVTYFVRGLTTEFRGLNLLEPESNDNYVNFDSSESDQGEKDLETIYDSAEVEGAAAHVLKALYTSDFADSLHDQVGKALEIYRLYCTGASMSEDTSISFTKYISRADAAVMAYARDAEEFYKYGPGVTGEDGTYKGADELLAEFWDDLDSRIDGGSTAGVFRVAHGETTMPFAALLQVPGSEKSADKNVPYTWANNPWRGEVAGLPAGNIEWVAYRNSKDKVVLTMRHNEKPVPFRANCTPITDESYFYELSELKNCLPAA